VIAACIFEAQTMFANAIRTLREHCIEGITANPDVCLHNVNYSIGTVTALNPVIGYERASELAAEAARTGRGILELVREKAILSEKQLGEVLDPMTMTARTSGVKHPSVLPSSRALLVVLTLASVGTTSRAQETPGAWRTFQGSWSAAGRRSTLATESSRPASIVQLSGSVVLTEGPGRTAAFQGEVIAFDDGSNVGAGRAVPDRQPRRSPVQRASWRISRRGTHHGSDHRRHRTMPAQPVALHGRMLVTAEDGVRANADERAARRAKAVTAGDCGPGGAPDSPLIRHIAADPVVRAAT
jgi:hypothetical protein